MSGGQHGDGGNGAGRGEDGDATWLGAAAKARSASVERDLEDVRARRGAYVGVPARAPGADDRLAVALLGARPLPARPRRIGPKIGAAGGVLAFAAALLLWLRAGPDGGRLPLYALEAPTQLAAMRGAVDAAAVFVTLTRDQEAVFVATPATDVGGPVEANAIVRGTHGERVWPGTIEITPQGVVRMAAPSRDVIAGDDVVDVELTVQRRGAAARRVLAARIRLAP